MTVSLAPTVTSRQCAVELFTQSYELRTALRRALNSAGNGFFLLQDNQTSRASSNKKTSQRNAVIVDANMPGIGGTALIKQICATQPGIPIMVVANDDSRGKQIKERVLAAGAKAVFMRALEWQQPHQLKPLALSVVNELKRVRPSSNNPAQEAPKARRVHTRQSSLRSRSRPAVLVIGSSTGGPQALIALFSSIEPERINVPVLIVQHMPASFTPILAEHISRATRWKAREARHGEALTSAEVRIAPGGRHMVIAGSSHAPTLELTDEPPVNFCRPAADVLFISAAQYFGNGVLGLVLTGMGHDGAQGAKTIVSAGGRVFAQDEASSVVWGMPGAAVATGVVEKVLPLSDVGNALQSTFAEVR